MTTYAEAAAIRTYDDDEIRNLWSAFYGICSHKDGEHVEVASPLQRTLLEALIKTAPLHHTRIMPHVGYAELVGYYPRPDERAVSIHITVHDEVCMMDSDIVDWPYFASTVV